MRIVIASIGVCLLAGGCKLEAVFQNGLNSTDPTERGLTCIAIAIVVGSVIRGVLNK